MGLIKSKIHGVKVDKIVDPSVKFDFPLLNNISYANGIIEKYIGKKKFLTKYLGKGTFGYAYLTKDGTVYKFTKNDKEAAASLILSMFGNKLETQGAIYKIYEIVLGSERLFVIEKEYIKPIGDYLEKELDLRSYQTYKPLSIIERLLETQFDEFSEFEESALHAANEEDPETLNIIKRLFNTDKKLVESIFEFNRHLKENENDAGMLLSDKHIGNIGVKNDRVVCFDCVTSSKYILHDGGSIKKKIKDSTIKSRLSYPDEPKIGKLGWNKLKSNDRNNEWEISIGNYDINIAEVDGAFDLLVYDSNDKSENSTEIDGGTFGSFDAAEEWLIKNYQNKKQDGGKTSEMIELKFGRYSSDKKIMTFTISDFKEMLNDIYRNFKTRLKLAHKLSDIFNYGTLFPDYISFNFQIKDININDDGQKLKNIIQKYAERVNWSRVNMILYDQMHGKSEWNVSVTMSPKWIDSQSNLIIGDLRREHKFQDESPSIDEIIPGHIELKDGGEIEIPYIIKKLRENKLYSEKTLGFENLSILVDIIIKQYLIYDRNNPIITRFNEAIYFEPSEIHTNREGLEKSNIEYALHFITGNVLDKNEQKRAFDKSKFDALQFLIPVLKSPDVQRLSQASDKSKNRQAATIYAKEISVGDGLCVILVAEINKGGAIRAITFIPKNKCGYIEKQKASKVWLDASVILPPPHETPPFEKGQIKAAGGSISRNSNNKDTNNSDNKNITTPIKLYSIDNQAVKEINIDDKSCSVEQLYAIYMREGGILQDLPGQRITDPELVEQNSLELERMFAMDKFVDMLQQKINDYFEKEYPKTFNINQHPKVSVKEGGKYIRIDIGSSGSFMLDKSDNHLYYIKGYGVIDKKKDFGNIKDIVDNDFAFDGYSILSKHLADKGQRTSYGYAGPIINGSSATIAPKMEDGGKIDIDEKKLFSLDKEYNGIIYLYQNDHPEIQYWFFIKKDFFDKKEESDFYYSVWQIKNASFLLSDILEKEHIGIIGQTSTWFNNSIRNRFFKINGPLFNHDNINYPISTYGLVSDGALSINIDDVIDIMAKEGNKNVLKEGKFNIVGLKQVKMYKRLGASPVVRSIEEYEKDPMVFVEEKEVLFGQGGEIESYVGKTVSLNYPIDNFGKRGGEDNVVIDKETDKAVHLKKGQTPGVMRDTSVNRWVSKKWIKKTVSGNLLVTVPKWAAEDGGDIGSLTKDKRYALTTDMYIYAPDDSSAIKQSQDYVNDLRDRLDNQAQIIEIVEAPFGSLKTRKLENVPRYNDGGEITEEMVKWMETLKPYKKFPNDNYYHGYKNGMVEGAKAAIIRYHCIDTNFDKEPFLKYGGKLDGVDTKYTRVIPRDLFNESKLLKCVGRLILLIHDNKVPVEMSFEENGDRFKIGLMDEGSLTITNLPIFIKNKQYTFKTTYNSKSNYPLYVQHDYVDYRVFDENGEFDNEFIEFCKNIPKYSDGGKTEKHDWENLPDIDLGVDVSKDWMKLWEKFTREHKLNLTLPHADPKDRGEQSDNAYFMLRHIVDVKRGNWKPDWKNDSQYKYYPWFYMETGKGEKSGFAFNAALVDHSSARVGSRLCFPSAELCDAVAKEFLEIYRVYMTEK